MRRDIRDFNLFRISDIQLLNDTFTMRPSFDIKAYFSSAFGIYKGNRTQQITLRFSPLKSRWVKGQIWHKDQKKKVFKDGSLQLTFPVADYAEIIMEILKHGPEVKVVSPKSLREIIRSQAKKIVSIY